MSYQHTVINHNPSQYYTFSGASGARDLSGSGSTGATGYTASSAIGLIAGSTMSGSATATIPNTYNIFSAAAKQKEYTVDFWCNPARGSIYGYSAQGLLSLALVSSSSAAIYYFADSFVLWLGRGVYVKMFAPNPDQRYHVSAIATDGYIQLVVNGDPSVPVKIPDSFVYASSDTTISVMTSCVSHLAIFDHAEPLDKIRTRFDSGRYTHGYQEVCIRDGAYFYPFDQTEIQVASDKYLSAKEFSLANNVNVITNKYSRMALPTPPTLSLSGVASYPSGLNLSGTLYGTVTQLSNSCSSEGGILGATFYCQSGVQNFFTIQTPSVNTEWRVQTNASNYPQVIEIIQNSNGTTTTNTYTFDSTMVGGGGVGKVILAMTQDGLQLNSSVPGDSATINKYGGLDFCPVKIKIDSSSYMFLAQDSTLSAAQPFAVYGLFFYDYLPSNYATQFDRLVTLAPTALFPLMSSTNASVYGDLTLTTTVPDDGNFYNSYVDYGMADQSLKPLEAVGLVAYYDARYVNGITGAAPADGAAIAQWNDLSGNNRHVTQGTTAVRPTYSATGASGSPGIKFDQTSSQRLAMISAGFLSSQSQITIYNVVIPIGMVFSNRPLGAFVMNSATTTTFLGQDTGSGLSLLRYAKSTGVSGAVLGPAIPEGTPSVFTASCDYTSLKATAAVNGITQLYTPTGTTGTFSAWDAIVIGRDQDLTYANGYVMASMIFNVAHTAAQRRQVESYLAMAFNLPSQKGNQVAVKYNSNYYEPVHKMLPVPNLGNTGTFGTTGLTGPMVVKVSLSTDDATEYSPELSYVSIRIPSENTLDCGTSSDVATIASYGFSNAFKSEDPQFNSRYSGLYMYGPGQITVPGSTAVSYELVVQPGSDVTNGELLCAPSGSERNISITGLGVTATGFSSVYLNGTLLAGTVNMNAHSPNHILAIGSTGVSGPVYINGHSAGTLKPYNHNILSYAQYNKDITSQVAEHYAALGGLIIASNADTDIVVIGENTSPVGYSYAWTAQTGSQD